MTEVLSIDWVQTVFLLWVETQRQRMHYNGPAELLLNGHAIHVTPRVIAYASSERIIIIRLVAHSSQLTQSLDVCVFGIFKIFYKKENKVKELKGETLKIYGAIAALYKFTIVQMVRGSFIRAEPGSMPRTFLVR
jgi:hypothetical protein